MYIYRHTELSVLLTQSVVQNTWNLEVRELVTTLRMAGRRAEPNRPGVKLSAHITT